MKQLIVKIALFIVVIFLVEKPIGYLVSKGIVKRQYDQRLEQLFQGEIRSDIIILGSSRSLNGIDAGELALNMENQTVYNFGFSGSNLNFHESIFNIITQVYIPQKILLVLDDENAFKVNEKAIYRKDKLFPFIQYEPILKEIVKNSSKSYLPSKVSWLYRENQNLFESINYFFKGKLDPDETTNVNEYGFIPLSNGENHLNKLVDRSLSLTYFDSEEQKTYIESLKSIVSKSNNLGISLYLVRIPSYKSKLLGFNERLNKIVGENIPILDFSNDLQDEKYHFDNGHLNALGAKKMASLISNRLKNDL